MTRLWRGVSHSQNSPQKHYKPKSITNPKSITHPKSVTHLHSFQATPTHINIWPVETHRWSRLGDRPRWSGCPRSRTTRTCIGRGTNRNWSAADSLRSGRCSDCLPTHCSFHTGNAGHTQQRRSTIVTVRTRHTRSCRLCTMHYCCDYKTKTIRWWKTIQNLTGYQDTHCRAITRDVKLRTGTRGNTIVKVNI